jgi:hypothetical protein
MILRRATRQAANDAAHGPGHAIPLAILKTASRALPGVLCQHCNIGLGHFRDDLTLVRRAAAYLDGHLTR